LWTFNVTASNLLTNASAGLYAFVYDGRPPLSPLKVQIQYILTQTGGVLNMLNGVPVYPRALETIIIVSGWQYADPANRLSLYIAIGSVSASWTAVGLLTGGSTSDDKIYFRLAPEATVNGRLVSVDIGVTVTASLSETFLNGPVVAQLNSRYKGQASCQIVEVVFPQNAGLIIYDPTMGNGDSPFPDDPPYGTNPPVAVILSVVGCILIVLIIVVVIISCRGRYHEYEEVK